MIGVTYKDRKGQNQRGEITSTEQQNRGYIAETESVGAQRGSQ